MFDDVKNDGFEPSCLVGCDGPMFRDYFLELPPHLILSECGYFSAQEDREGGDEDGSLAPLRA